MGGVGNHFGLNTHENGVAWGTNAVNQLSHGVASGQGATVTRGNLTREQYQEGVRQYQSLLDEKNQLTAQKAQLEGNKELKEGEITALNNRIDELNNKMSEYHGVMTEINEKKQSKESLELFVRGINDQITAKEGEYNLSDKTRIYEFEDFYKTLNKLDWAQYGNSAGVDNLADQLKARVSEFSPNIANKYGQDKYKEIINAYASLNSIDKQPTVDWFNERLTTKDMGLGYYFEKNNTLDILGSDYDFFDFKYKNNQKNNNGDKYNSGYISEESNSHYYKYNDLEKNVKNTDVIWRYAGTTISDQYINELEWMYNNLDNTTNYSLYITRNTLRAALNKDAQNLKLRHVSADFKAMNTDYLLDLYANFGEINLVQSLQKAINDYGSEDDSFEYKEFFNRNIKLDEIDNTNIAKASELANGFIHDYEGIDLNATAKNVVSIEETRNLFKPFYDKMIQLRDITNLYKEINSGTLDETTKQQKQAVYLQKLSNYRNALNAEIDHYYTLEGYIAHFVRPYVRYSDEFVNHFKTATREYIDFLKANRHKLLSYDPNDEFIKEISDKAKSLIQDLKNLNDQKSAKEKEIEGINDQLNNLNAKLGPDEQALNQQKQEKQTELEKAQKEKEQLDAQVAEKEKELARKQAEVLEKLKQQSGEGNAVAIGDNSFASGVSAVALGVRSESIGDHALALGTQAKATKSDSIAIGHGTEVTGEQSIAIGKGHRVSGNRSTTIGDPNTITGDDSVAVGNNNTINSNHVMVLGNNVTVGENLHHSVVLGSNSTVLSPVATTSHTIAGTQYNFAGTAPVATVSIGTEGKERTLTNLAAGRISNTSTDGINGSQLNAVIETLNSLNTELTTLKNAPKGGKTVVKAGDGLSLTEGEDGSITLSNALNFNAGNGINVNKEGNNITITNTQPLSNENKTKYDNASTTADNALEKANNALPKDGLISGEGISIQPKGDKLEISSTVKGGNGNENAPLPLKAGVGISIQDKEGKSEISTNLNGSGIEITQNEDGSVTLTNNIEAGSGVELERSGNKIIIKSKPIKQKLIDDAGRTLEKDSIKVTGGKNVTTVVKNGDFAVGLNDDIEVKSVTSDDITVKNKISVGDNELSKDGLKVATVRINKNGISAGGKVINDVKEGEVSETSQQAINGSQLHQTHQMINQVAMGVGENRQMIQAVNQRVDGLAQHVEKTSKSLRAGVAGSVATASLPQVYASGKSMVSAATGHYKNQNAIAIGYSKASDNGKLVFKVNASANTSKDVTVGTGIGYQW